MIIDALLNYPWKRVSHWLCSLGAIFAVSLILIVIGIVWMQIASKRYQWILGYRIAAAVQDERVWQQANRMMGKALFIIGFAAIPLSAIIMFPFRHQTISAVITLGCGIILLIFVISFIAHTQIKKKAERMLIGEAEN